MYWTYGVAQGIETCAQRREEIPVSSRVVSQSGEGRESREASWGSDGGGNRINGKGHIVKVVVIVIDVGFVRGERCHPTFNFTALYAHHCSPNRMRICGSKCTKKIARSRTVSSQRNV